MKCQRRGSQRALVAGAPYVVASKAAIVYEKKNCDNVADMRVAYRLLPRSEPLK